MSGKLKDGIIKYAGANTPGWVSNLGLSYSGGTLKITDIDGNDLSASNPGWVTVPRADNSTGAELRYVTLKVTDATHLFEDAAGASDIVGVNFESTTSVAWGDKRPFFLYAVNSDDSDSGLAFGISLCPTYSRSPATSLISYHGNPPSTDNLFGMFFLTDTDVTATHDQKGCAVIGGIAMVKDTSDDWTVTLDDADLKQGIIPRPFEGYQFRFPTGQHTATAGSHVYSHDWTFTSPEFKYSINMDGRCHIDTTLNVLSAGTTSTDCRVVLPYKPSNGTDDPPAGRFANIPPPSDGMLTLESDSSNFRQLLRGTVGNTTNFLDFSDMDSSSIIHLSFTFLAFGNNGA
jgi:hypothetical protein